MKYVFSPFSDEDVIQKVSTTGSRALVYLTTRYAQAQASDAKSRCLALYGDAVN